MKKIAITLILLMTMTEIVEARSRFKRSFGRRSSRSLFSNKKKSPSRTFQRKQSTRPKKNFNNNQNTNRRSGGSFLRSMGGAFAGTMLGGMLFRAFGMGTGAGAGAGGGGGFLIILLLIGAGAFFYFRYRKPAMQSSYQYSAQDPSLETDTEEETDELGLLSNTNFINDRNKDFFSIQHAWSKKDIQSVKDIMTTEVASEFQNEITEMDNKGHTSTLENLMIQQSQIVSSWNELELQCATIKFDVSLIEYESDTNGNIVSGSKDSYTDISEYWTFTKAPYDSHWKVSAVENEGP